MAPELTRRLAPPPSLLRWVERLALVAEHDVPVLLTGESGRGKTHRARLLHDGSPSRWWQSPAAPCRRPWPTASSVATSAVRSPAPTATGPASGPPPAGGHDCSTRSTPWDQSSRPSCCASWAAASRLRNCCSNSRAADIRGVGAGVGHLRVALRAAAAAAVGPQPPHLPEQLVTGHGRQQTHQPAGRVEVILPGGGADEEAGPDRLADVHGIEEAAKIGVGQAGPDRPAHGRPVVLDQLRLGGIVAAPHSADEVMKGMVRRHRRTPRTGRRTCSLFVPAAPGAIKRNFLHGRDFFGVSCSVGAPIPD